MGTVVLGNGADGEVEGLELVLGDVGKLLEVPGKLPQLFPAEGGVGGSRLENHRGDREVEEPVFDRGAELGQRNGNHLAELDGVTIAPHQGRGEELLFSTLRS